MKLGARLFEKTAIFKAPIQQYNRFSIPDEEVEVLGIKPGDTVRVMMYEVEGVNSVSGDRVTFPASVQKSMRVTIPKRVRDVHGLGPKDKVQVVIRKVDTD